MTDSTTNPSEANPSEAKAPEAQAPEAKAPAAEAPEVKAPEVKPCRHEYVRIFQRKLKGLERRMVSTKAWLPIGFKVGDFSHLGEGSFCFCTKCRTRLYPRRTQAEKAANRLALAQGKAQALEAESFEGADLADGEVISVEEGIKTDIHVEELELEGVDVQDIEAEGVKLAEENEPTGFADEDE